MSVSRHQTTVDYRLRIQLRGISPPIWRRLLIPINSTILNLHEATQAAMGWEDIHLNRFTIRGQLYGVPRDGGMSFSTLPDRLQLIDFGFCEHDRFVYEYDLYSRWIHDIRVEKVLDFASLSLPTCIAGVGACPPEGSGPVDTFMQQHDEHSIVDTLEWIQESLDDNTPMADMREELIDRLRWINNRFNRHEASTRLRATV